MIDVYSSSAAPASGSPWGRRGRQSGRRLVGAGAVLWLAGCATSADPHAGGFVSGVVGLAGGGYQQRIDERQGTYQGELDAGQRLQAQARELERERAELKGELAHAQSQLADLERRIARQRAALRAQGAATAATRAQAQRLDQAQQRLASAKGALREANPNAQSVPDLKVRAQAVQRDLDAIDGLVASVGGKGF